MTARTADVVVVGAGIVGAACARGLAREGLSVIVVDSRPPGAGTTGAGMGHIAIMRDSPAQFALSRYSRQLWDELADDLPPQCEFDRCGAIWIAADEDETAEVVQKHDFLYQQGIDAEILDDRELLEEEPNLAPGLAGGLRLPGDCVVYPPCAAGWFLEEAKRMGAAIHLGSEVVELTGDEVRLANSTTFTAKFTVNAGGPWAAKLTPGIPVRPRKGHLVITDRYPGFVRHQLLELGYLKSAHGEDKESVAMVIQPRKTGQVLVGSSRQLDVAAPEVEHRIVGKMLARALTFMPALASLSATRVWTGLRAATPDSLPLIGPHPEFAGLLLATGHEGLGITTSTGTGELIAAHVTGKKPAIDTTPFLPERFAGKHYMFERAGDIGSRSGAVG